MCVPTCDMLWHSMCPTVAIFVWHVVPSHVFPQWKPSPGNMLCIETTFCSLYTFSETENLWFFSPKIQCAPFCSHFKCGKLKLFCWYISVFYLTQTKVSSKLVKCLFSHMVIRCLILCPLEYRRLILKTSVPDLCFFNLVSFHFYAICEFDHACYNLSQASEWLTEGKEIM